MKQENSERVDEFLRQLEDALPKNRGRRDEVREEVEGDLLALIEKELESGSSEEDSVNRALDEMGNPFELAYRISEVAAPTQPPVLSVLRYILAGGILLWTLYVAWGVRAWGYGFEGSAFLAGVLLFHFPMVLVIWPGVVWRPNWLFGLIPVGIVIAVAMGASLLGTQTTQTYTLEPVGDQGSEAVAMIPSSQGDGQMPLWARWLLLVGLFGVFSVLVLAVQQARQRRHVLLVAGLFFFVLETSFQIEEGIFRSDWKRIQGFAASFEDEVGRVLTKEELDSKGPRLGNESFHFYARETGGYSLYWNRPLSSGFALIADSESDTVRVQD